MRSMLPRVIINAVVCVLNDTMARHRGSHRWNRPRVAHGLPGAVATGKCSFGDDQPETSPRMTSFRSRVRLVVSREEKCDSSRGTTLDGTSPNTSIQLPRRCSWCRRNQSWGSTLICTAHVCAGMSRLRRGTRFWYGMSQAQNVRALSEAHRLIC